MTSGGIPDDPLSSALQHVLLAHTRAQAHLARSLGVSRTDVDALEHLMTGPLSAIELARRLGVSQPAVTHLLGRLERRGHARRAADPSDGRRVAVELTEAGRSAVVAHVLPMLHRLDELARQLDPPASRAVLGYLEGSTSALLDLASAQSGADVRRSTGDG
ncbi:MarR family winged helix-turn-helix transcriptional regulator [Nocardioides kribbensis]|uniref:MarR family winged helix-turn-helix transcriptional regulator n=1 Tax=Nocardioides kribbensis TaxID=305517 RepID=UPI0032DB3DAA